MDVAVKTTSRKTIVRVTIRLPIEEVERDDAYGDCPSKMPVRFRDNRKGVYELKVSPSGVVLDWPNGIVIDALFKPRDGGEYWIVFSDGMSMRIGEYVPRCLGMGDGGDDYIELKIDGNGNIAGWNDVFTDHNVAADLEDAQ